MDIGFYFREDGRLNHDPDCTLLEVMESVAARFDGHKDEFYRQRDGDDSELMLGEALSSGEIRVSIDTKPARAYPDYRPYYS